ncbi:MAG: DUF6075 family protein [Bacillota bacterium]
MNKKLFIDDEHFKSYEKYLEKSNTDKDLYRKSLLYILSSLDKFRRNIERIYNFDVGNINLKTFEEIPLSDSEEGLLRLAFHLFNYRNEFNLDSTFNSFESKRLKIALNAIQIRYYGNSVYEK